MIHLLSWYCEEIHKPHVNKAITLSTYRGRRPVLRTHGPHDPSSIGRFDCRHIHGDSFRYNCTDQDRSLGRAVDDWGRRRRTGRGSGNAVIKYNSMDFCFVVARAQRTAWFPPSRLVRPAGQRENRTLSPSGPMSRNADRNKAGCGPPTTIGLGQALWVGIGSLRMVEPTVCHGLERTAGLRPFLGVSSRTEPLTQGRLAGIPSGVRDRHTAFRARVWNRLVHEVSARWERPAPGWIFLSTGIQASLSY